MPFRTMRIVSLLPSATEIVYALGLGDWLVARSHECDYPPDALRKPVITRSLIPPDLPSSDISRMVSETLQTHGTLYTINQELLLELQPDIILTQALCSVCAVSHHAVLEAVEALRPHPLVVNLEPTTLDEVLHTFQMVADVSGVPQRGERLVAHCRERIEQVRACCANKPSARVSFLEWIDPPFACGHWTPELIALAGGIDGHSQAGSPSRRLEWREVLEWQPEVIVIACCGFTVERARQDLPLLESQPGWRDLPAVRRGAVLVADGNAYFSRPGPRLVDSLEWLASSIHHVSIPPSRRRYIG